jgi:hypothetical protein
MFFDEFYEELERIAVGISEGETVIEQPLLAEETRERWHPFIADHELREGVLISVDGGVQYSNFAYGDLVAVGRACALLNGSKQDREMLKDVKIHVDKVYDQRDRGFIPGYVRMITEYRAAVKGARRVLENGKTPYVFMDGSLYFSRFPYAAREYIHHGELLTELFTVISELRELSSEFNFPIVGISKDSTVFYMYMVMLREAVRKAGLHFLSPILEDATSPLNLRLRMDRVGEDDRTLLEPFIEQHPLCDTALVRETTTEEGYSHPLLLAPSIYYGRDENTTSLYNRIKENIGRKLADPIIKALNSFFNSSGVATIYWKPKPEERPFRVDISASWLGNLELEVNRKRNRFMEEGIYLEQIEKVLNHLDYWFINSIEYNIPLKQADMLARFDRELYRNKYEPFIVKRLEAAGLRLTEARRSQRELDG